MSILRKKSQLLNLLLLILGICLSILLWNQWTHFKAENNLNKISGKLLTESNGLRKELQTSSPSNYKGIDEHHLFHFHRNNLIPEDPKPVVVAAVETKVVKPKPVLMGTMGFGKNTYALMVSRESVGKTKLYRRIKIGQSMDGFTLVQILMDKVVMQSEDGVVEIRIDEGAKNVPQSRSRKPKSRRTARKTVRGIGTTRSTRSTVSSSSSSRKEPITKNNQGMPPTTSVPVGTVVNGKRLVEVPSPFGPTRTWVEVNPKRRR